MYKLELSRQAVKDAIHLERAGLKDKTSELMRILRKDPFQTPYEKLTNRDNVYSRRITIKHRLVYRLEPNDENIKNAEGQPYQGIVYILRMWSHYD